MPMCFARDWPLMQCLFGPLGGRTGLFTEGTAPNAKRLTRLALEFSNQARHFLPNGLPPARELAPVVERNVATQVVPQENLAGARDLLLRIEQHLFPLRDPARGTRNREKNRKHGHREAHRLVNQ